MLYVDDIVLVDETRIRVNTKLKIWQDTLESKSFRLSWTKIEYMECKFSKGRNTNKELVILNGQEILKSESFRYLGSIIHRDGEIKEDVNHRIKVGCGWSGEAHKSKNIFCVKKKIL